MLLVSSPYYTTLCVFLVALGQIMQNYLRWVHLKLIYDLAGLDKSFSNVVVRWATMGPYLVAQPKKWLPRNYLSIIKLNMYVETYEKRML